MNLFGTFEKKMQYRLPLESDETTAWFIKRISYMMKQALVEDNVRNAFTRIDLQ
jgi:hypothetical protein